MTLQTLAHPASAAHAGTTWTIDPDHSTVAFSIKHMVVAVVRGRFTRFHGTIQLDDLHPQAASVEAEIEVASIDTGIAFRDDHLRSVDFFDAAAYPLITFRSTRVEPVGARDRWVVTGDLTVSGVTRPVELAVKRTSRGAGPAGGEVVGFAATATIDRTAFGIGDSLLLQRGGLVIGDEVAVTIEIRAHKGPTGAASVVG